VRRETYDRTTDPALRSWVQVPPGSDFPIQNLPYGTFTEAGNRPRIGIAIGESILALDVAAETGLLDDACPDARRVFAASTLNAFLGSGRAAWRAVRERISTLLDAGDSTLRERGIAGSALVRQRDVLLTMPLAIGDFVDFYSSLDHATNVGTMFRPDGEALPPNWRSLPIGYHARTATVVCGGTPVVRPRGQTRGAGAPRYGPTRALDFELELGFVSGDGPLPPAGIPVERARDHIFGVALLNDWSARDLQAWEAQPLGPFLAKSFATSLAPWIVTLDALQPFRVATPPQAPPPLPYLATADDETYDISLTVALLSNAMRARGSEPAVVTRTNFRRMYWSMAQQLAHASSNGARVRAGDLFGSGTISGATPDARGCLLELTWNGQRPIALAGAEPRTYLEDGDEVVMNGHCEREGFVRIGLGELRARVLPALDS
jgi:fumarylacetoacetase